jgi:hypothetical protein
MIVITVLRKGAWKTQVLACDNQYHLSICQIFESTDDVVQYSVVDMDVRTYTPHNMFIPDSKDFPKWKEVLSIPVSE